jgi:glucose/mannose-6-phosphate isomerase
MTSLRNDITRLDPSGMFTWLTEFPDQVRDAVSIGEKAKIRISTRGVEQILLTGLGGSAIGGDLLRSYLSGELRIPFIVNRHYFLPAFVSQKTLVIVSSYSGNTEETTAAHADAIKRKARVLCISTNGTVAKTAARHKQPLITIPPGLSPRAALGYSFFPLLVTLGNLGFIKPKKRDIAETIEKLTSNARIFGDPDAAKNPPLELARKLKGRLPVIYSPTDLDGVNIRWRGQIAENAKQLSSGHVLPEMNHNELVGWKVLTSLMKNMAVVFLRDHGTHKRVQVREDITRSITLPLAESVTDVWSEGTSLLTRTFSLIQFGDWVSFYLAILNNENPTPVDVIDYLKGELARV